MRIRTATQVLACVLVYLVFGGAIQPAAASRIMSDDERARTLVHVLDYVAADYPAAIADGVIVDSLEYAEMVQFAIIADSLVADLVREGQIERTGELTRNLAALREGIDGMATPDEVAGYARALRNEVIRGSGLVMTPSRWPDIERGASLFATHCVSCHGVSGAGDGPLAASLEPAPANLASGSRIAGISPFQAYNTVRLGVGGTGMTGFTQLSEEATWDLAFFVKAIRASAYRDSTARVVRDGGSGPAAPTPSDQDRLAPLDEVSVLGDQDLAAALVSRGVEDAMGAVAAIRLARPPRSERNSLDTAEDHLVRALDAFRDGRVAEARSLSITAYLEGVEPVELILRASDPALVAELERRMMVVRAAIHDGDPVPAVEEAVDQALVVVAQAKDRMDSEDHSAWFIFGMAISILLREALEAFLIIIAILGVIRATGPARAARWVHGGWLAAVGVGLAAWFLADRLLDVSAANRELLEGGISLLAVVVLLSVGFWLHDKSAAHRWKAFLETRVRSELGRGNLIGLAAFAFFAVFREAIESVLFLSALGLEGGEGTSLALGAATVTSLALVLLLGVLALRYSARLPIRQLFRYASVLIVVLAIVLAGKGIHSLQEAGSLSVSIPGGFTWRSEWLGIYPTVETLVAQGLVIVIVGLLLYVTRRLAKPSETRPTPSG